MAKTAAPPTQPAEARPTDVAAKAAAVGKKVAGLRADLALAHDMIHQAQVREALSRSELTLALTEALIARAKSDAAVRQEVARRYLQAAQRRPVRRHGRLARGLDRLLIRLGRTGQARVIAEAGVWRGGELAEIGAYVRRGADATAEPIALFDQAGYLAAHPDAAASGLPPLVHYLVRGAFSGYAPHPLIHPNYYHERNAAALRASQVSPLEHFVCEGAALGRNPHPAFDVLHYAVQGPELAAGEDPASHYLRAGWRDSLSPHPLFDPAWYRRQMPRQAAEIAPLVHYLTVGWREGLSPHPLFDPKWYVEQNPDVAEAGTEPLTHFLTGGAAEGRSPSPWFDTAHYMAARGDALDPAANPLVDYLQGGAWAVAEARPGFPTAAYLAQSPEVVGQGMTPLEHWARKAARS
ncbi:MAG TPA: hypothetical protein VFE18_08195 [Phenylobacterium sp.]|uniref:hypothetical protein n=1 Tax=Phenylobacterium sp. TaxID=1871053 RepID=UPI002D3B121E|nr:hypothetical protein [Phenylobacterium sp.]HZZ68141.1 hypothetical protein [Phenylobacterium sp.]